jgi:hypothetical protein
MVDEIDPRAPPVTLCSQFDNLFRSTCQCAIGTTEYA